MAKFWNSIFLNGVFFITLGITATLYVVGHFYAPYVLAAHILLGAILLFTILDAILLYMGNNLTGERVINPILSNGDENPCTLKIKNNGNIQLLGTVYEEIPHQLDKRELKFSTTFSPNSLREITYTLEPKVRGSYDFGDIIAIVTSPLRLIRRKYTLPAQQSIDVYPSYIHLNKYNLKNFKHVSSEAGHKKVRRIGQSTEFEHIKDYVKGDDIRYINWKASAKRDQLMVNQYTDERAQQIYCLIDTGRAMEMPFEGLSLLDYAINSALALSHVIVKNHDKAGILYFNKRVEKILPADKSMGQLPKILNLLYNVETEYYESNFEKLYVDIKFRISHRSLMILYTNFEDMNSLHRQLPYLQGIAKNNVLVVVLFLNSELENVIETPAKTTNEYYYKSVAEKLSYQKKLMVKELRKYGIQTILTHPTHLTTDAIDKYLTIKNRGIL